MCERVRFLLRTSGSGHVTCDLGAVTRPDAGTVEALARMQLAALRLGGRLELRNACGELRELLELAGLTDVLPCEELAPETGRQAEEREQPGGVEEEGDPAEPVA